MVSGSTEEGNYSWKLHPSGQGLRLTHTYAGPNAFIDFHPNDPAIEVLKTMDNKPSDEVTSHPALKRHFNKLNVYAQSIGHVSHEQTQLKGKQIMEKKTKKSNKEVIHEADAASAAATLQTHPTPASSRAGMMAQAMTQMAAMDVSQLQAILAQIGHEADNIPNGAAAQNKASVDAKGDVKSAMTAAMKEDVSELFGSEELTEEFKEKTAVLFEAAVNARVIAETTRIEEEYEVKLYEEVEAGIETLTEQIDQYLSYCAEQWLADNEVAIESSLRNEITEQFIAGLHNLFQENYMSVPEEQTDVVEALAGKVAELENKLNEQIKDNIELTDVLEQYTKEEILDEVSEGLALTQVEKLRTLSEGVDFDSVDSYKKKLEIIKENYFKKNTVKTTLTEENYSIDEPGREVVYTDPSIRSYAQAISRTIKR